jgi:hypothetical protein
VNAFAGDDGEADLAAVLADAQDRLGRAALLAERAESVELRAVRIGTLQAPPGTLGDRPTGS